MARPGSSTDPPRVETLTDSRGPRPLIATPNRGTSTWAPELRTSTLALRIFTLPNSNRSRRSGRH